MRKSDDAICLLAALDEGYVPQLGVLLTSIYLNHPGEPFCTAAWEKKAWKRSAGAAGGSALHFIRCLRRKNCLPAPR